MKKSKKRTKRREERRPTIYAVVSRAFSESVNGYVTVVIAFFVLCGYSLATTGDVTTLTPIGRVAVELVHEMVTEPVHDVTERLG